MPFLKMLKAQLKQGEIAPDTPLRLSVAPTLANPDGPMGASERLRDWVNGACAQLASKLK
jgi:hypothetical protein